MKESDFEVLSVIGEAVITAQGGTVIFANPPAQILLGKDCVGKKLERLLGKDIAGTQSSGFTANASVNGRECIVRASGTNDRRILIINPVKYDSSVINDAFLFSMRGALMVLSMAAERSRQQAEELGAEELAYSTAAITKSTAAVTRLVTNLSTVRNMSVGNLSFTPRLLNLSQVIEDFAQTAGAMLDGTEIVTRLPESLPCAGDSELIELMLTNLVCNSVLHGRSKRISIRLINSGESVIIAVNDDGVGIKNEEMHNIFERYLSSNSISELNRGAGLGLTVVRGIAQLHGGTVLLESRKGHGTAVRVSLRKNTVSTVLRANEPQSDSTRKIMIGLSDCLPEKSFRARYMD